MHQTNKKTASVCSMSDEHKSVVLTVFQTDISKGMPLTMAKVRERMCTDLYLRRMVVNIEFVKKIADFVRYKTNHTRQMQLTQLSELDSSNFVPSSGSKSGFHKTWNIHDATVIENKFNGLPNVRSKKQIMELFNSDDVLRHILEREGGVCCYEKAKNVIQRKNH